MHVFSLGVLGMRIRESVDFSLWMVPWNSLAVELKRLFSIPTMMVVSVFYSSAG